MTKAKILCVEDDPDMIDYVKLILGQFISTVNT